MDLLPFTTFWVTLSISQLASLWKAVAQVSALTNRVVWQAGCCTGCYSNWRKHVVVGSCVAIVHSEHTVKQDSTERYLNSTSRFRLKSKCRTVRSIKATESSCVFFWVLFMWGMSSHPPPVASLWYFFCLWPCFSSSGLTEDLALDVSRLMDTVREEIMQLMQEGVGQLSCQWIEKCLFKQFFSLMQIEPSAFYLFGHLVVSR